jgi:hypothetical protein
MALKILSAENMPRSVTSFIAPSIIPSLGSRSSPSALSLVVMAFLDYDFDVLPEREPSQLEELNERKKPYLPARKMRHY